MKKNVFVVMTIVALVLQMLMLVLFFALPDPLGLSMSEMYAGKTIWQVFMAFGAILVMSSIFAFAKSPRGLAVFYIFYFFFSVVDYEVVRFNHQRLSYSFIRTYFHPSNAFDATTLSTLGGDALGTFFWLSLAIAVIVGGITFCVAYTVKQKNIVR